MTICQIHVAFFKKILENDKLLLITMVSTTILLMWFEFCLMTKGYNVKLSLRYQMQVVCYDL